MAALFPTKEKQDVAQVRKGPGRVDPIAHGLEICNALA
jgi:hypothetical protein